MGLVFGDAVRRSVASNFQIKRPTPDICRVGPCRFYAGGAVIKLKRANPLRVSPAVFTLAMRLIIQAIAFL